MAVFFFLRENVGVDVVGEIVVGAKRELQIGQRSDGAGERGAILAKK